MGTLTPIVETTSTASAASAAASAASAASAATSETNAATSATNASTSATNAATSAAAALVSETNSAASAPSAAASAASVLALSLLERVANLTALRAIAPTAGNYIYLEAHTTTGGGGVFSSVTGAAVGTYTDNNFSIIVPAGGDGSSAFLRETTAYGTPEMAGAIGDGIADDTVAINAADAAYPLCILSDKTYRINSAITPVSGHAILGTKNSWLYQYGAYAFQSTTDLLDWSLDGVSLKLLSGSTNPYDCAFSLGAHRRCAIKNIYCLSYDSLTIIERIVPSTAANNTVDNLYADWYITACRNLSVSIGYSGTYYHMHQGDGATTAINTGIIWPELLDSSVVVMKENSNRIFSQLIAGTDYTLTYPASVLNVALTIAATTNERIHIWPAQPIANATRRTISNNDWERVKCEAITGQGHVNVRWVDGENYATSRLVANANNVKLFVNNPYTNRTGQGGDNLNFNNMILTYNSVNVTAPSSLRGYVFGPGSLRNSGNGIIMDLLWRPSGSVNRAIDISDTDTVTLSGTINTTNGSLIVTGTGTFFTKEITLVGTTPDNIIIVDPITGTEYLRGIASIDSDTQITLSVIFGATFTGATAKRFNKENAVSYSMQFASTGDGNLGADVGTYEYRSGAYVTGSVTIPVGAISTTVTFKSAARNPLKEEVSILPQTDLGGRSFYISNMTATTFDILLSSVDAVNAHTFGWKIELLTMS